MITNKGETVGRFIIIIVIISILTMFVVKIYGGHLKDAITKSSCPLIGEEYVSGESSGEGKCIIPAGAFD